MEHFPHQRVPPEKPVVHFIEVLEGVTLSLARFGAFLVCSPVLEADRVGGKDGNPPHRQCWAKRLQGIANQPAYLAFPQMPLAVVLVVDEYSRKWSGAFWEQQKSRDGASFAIAVSDPDP